MLCVNELIGFGSRPVPAAFVGPLDAYTSGLRAAHSVTRRLLSTYEGALIRIRRDSDDAAQDIGYNGSNLLDTASIVAFLAGANGFVVRVYDQHSGALHQVQETTANQAAYQAAGFQSGPCFNADGSNDGYHCSSGVALGGHSIHLAGKWNISGDALLVEHGASGDGSGFYLNAGRGTDADHPHLVNRYPTPGITMSARHATRVANNAATIVSYRNGGTAAGVKYRRDGSDVSLTTSGGDAGTATKTTSLNWHRRANGTLPVPGQSSEMVLYDGAQSDADFNAVHGNLRTFYGTP